MSEHDDDLESTVEEESETDTETFSDTGDEVDAIEWEANDVAEDLDLDEDEAEL